MANAPTAKPYVHQDCHMCRDTAQGIRVVGNPEVFCSMRCCKIFYSRPVEWISQHRKERLQ
jgi:hypothetical protein